MSTPETALTVVARAALALGSDKARTELAELVKKSANIVEVKNSAGREECHSAAMVLVRARTNIEKIGKAARDDATKFSKAVIAEEKALISITQPEEDRLLGLRDAWDAARAAEKAEAERVERERVAAIHARIGRIKGFATLALECRTSAKVEELIERLMAEPAEGFEEFAEEAANARGLTLARMKEISDAKLLDEQERARIAAEQEAERQRLAAERAELERQQAEARAAQDRLDAERRAQAEADAAELARQRAALAEENARINAEHERQRAAQAAEAARLAEERAALERQHAQTAAALAAATSIPEPLKSALTDVVTALAPDPVIQMIEPAQQQRPTDIQIVEAVAAHFGVAEPVALSWLIDIDVETALEVYEPATA
jgi:hypothetical protein